MVDFALVAELERSGASASGRGRRRGVTLPVWTALLVLAATGARLLHLRAPAAPDEAGYLLVAAAAHPGGRFVYGDLWVDRPPLLVAFFRLAAAAGGLPALRALALVPVTVLVVAAARAGFLLGGQRGGRRASAATAALAVTSVIGAWEIDGELLAVPLVMVSCALGLDALTRHSTWCRRPRDPAALLAAAGAVGAMALLFKQNFADALVFLAAMVVASIARREVSVRRGLGQLGLLAAGAALPLTGAVVWSIAWGSGPAALWQALFGFRAASLQVIAASSSTAPAHRAALLLEAALGSGLLPVLAVFLVAAMARGRRVDPASAAITAMTITSVAAISLGGSYWVHYLIELLPASALALAISTRRAGTARVASAAALGLVIAASVVAVVPASGRALPWVAQGSSCAADSTGAAQVGDWLRRHAHPGDSVATVYGGANTILGSGLRVAYPYLWSLPIRTLDPRLDRLRAALAGPGAATWVVRTLPLHSWNLDPHHQLQDELARNYRPAATVCGHQVLLRADLTRPPRALTELTRSAT